MLRRNLRQKRYHNYSDDESDYSDEDDGEYPLPMPTYNDQLLPPQPIQQRVDDGDDMQRLLAMSMQTYVDEQAKKNNVPVPNPVVEELLPPLPDDPYERELQRILAESLRTHEMEEIARKNIVPQPPPIMVPAIVVPQHVDDSFLPSPVIAQATVIPQPDIIRPFLKTKPDVPVLPSTTFQQPVTTKQNKYLTQKPPLSIIDSYKITMQRIGKYDEKLKQLDDILTPKLSQYFENSEITNITLNAQEFELYNDVVQLIRMNADTREFFNNVITK